MPTISDLRQRQALPLEAKVTMSKVRIREWYQHFNGDVYVSFFGGKDSTVLAHLVRDMYPDVPLVFVNTGLEYLQVQTFARKMGAEFLRPKMRFDEVISKYGYPIIGKEVALGIYYARRPVKNSYSYREKLMGLRKYTKETGETIDDLYNMGKWLPLCSETMFLIHSYCCTVMKKAPTHDYEKRTSRKQYVGMLAEESRLREQKWQKTGCNAYDAMKKVSMPLSFWTEQDILKYIKQNGIEIASVYGDIVSVDNDGFVYEPLPGVDCKLKCSGCQRTGCIYCCFGLHLEKGETRFQLMAKTNPREYEYCLGGGQWVDNPNYDPTMPTYDGDWKNWNPPKIWVPSKKGLGMKKVFDDCNQIYGKDFIRYE